MRKILLLMVILAISLVNVVSAHDTVAKLNFTYGINVDGWTSVDGMSVFPVILDNNITIDYTGGDLAMGTSGEATSTVVPDAVSGTYNWWSNADDTPGTFTFIGLDAAEKYTFVIYASRDDSDGALTEDRSTTYTILGQASTLQGTLNPVGNTDQLVVLSDIVPAATGAVVMEVTKLSGQYGYINALIILKQTASVGGQTPYGGTPWSIPGTIEAEDFDEGGEGVAYHDDEETNFGGAYRTDVGVDINSNGTIGWFKDGEWMEYTVNVEAGTYDISVWSGTEFDLGQALAIYLDEELITVINIPYTGSWDPTEYVVSDIELPEVQGGVLKFLNVADDYDFDKVVFTKTSTDVATHSTAMKYYPVPATDALTIENIPSMSQIVAFDITGRKVIDRMNGNESIVKIDMSNLRAGIYLFKVSNSSIETKAFKVVKK